MIVLNSNKYLMAGQVVNGMYVFHYTRKDGSVGKLMIDEALYLDSDGCKHYCNRVGASS